MSNVTRRVDVHTHYMAGALADALRGREMMPRIVEEPGRKEIQYGEGSGHELLDSMLDLDLKVEDMDRDGIDLAVLSVNVPGVDSFEANDGIAIAQDVNDELIEIVAGRGERFAAMALLPMQAPDAAAAELERAVTSGLRGGMVFSNAVGRPIDEAEYEDLYGVAARLGVPIVIHPTFPLSASAVDAYALISTLGFLVDTTTAALRLIHGGIYDRYPDLRLVLCHAGSLLPQIAGRLDREAMRLPGGMGKLEVPPSERVKQLYTDVVCSHPPALRSALELFGPERVMFGSDEPFWQASWSTEVLDDLPLSVSERARIESGTAEEVYGL